PTPTYTAPLPADSAAIFLRRLRPRPAGQLRFVVIGGTGHIGTFLIPRLVSTGHDVIVASRGKREPYVPHPAWNAVRRIEIDRAAEDAARTFGARIASLEAAAVGAVIESVNSLIASGVVPQ